MLGAIIGGVLSIGSALLSSKSNKKAIKQATQAQSDSTAAQIGYQREADARNLQYLSPWMQRGNVAGDTIMAALGLGGSVTTPQAYSPQGALTVPYTGPNPAAVPGYAEQYRMSALDAYPMNEGGALGMPGAPTMGAPVQAGTTPQQGALAAYELFKQSTGYQTRFSEGMRGLNAAFAGRGVLQSGAAVKSALRYGQEFASNEFGNWMGALDNQQNYGFAGASALGGVAQGSADRMGALSRNSADFATQAAVARAQNQGALYTAIGGAAGNAVGALSSYLPKRLAA